MIVAAKHHRFYFYFLQTARHRPSKTSPNPGLNSTYVQHPLPRPVTHLVLRRGNEALPHHLPLLPVFLPHLPLPQ